MLTMEPPQAALAVGDVVFAEGVVGPAAVQDGAEEPSGAFDLVPEAVIFGVTSGGVGTTEAGGGAELDGVGPRVGDETLFLFEKDEEDLRVDVVSLGGIVDNLGGGFGGFALSEEVTVVGGDEREVLVGKADEVAVFDVIVEVWIPGGLDGVSVVTVPFLVEKSIDVGKRHGGVVAHGVVGDDVARAEVGEGDGLRFSREAKSEEGEGGNKGEEEGNFIN